MAILVPMVAHNSVVVALGLVCALAAQTAPSNSPPQVPTSPASSNTQPQDQSETSSSKKSHGKNVRHVRVEEEGSTAPELVQAEALIQKRDYAAAEPLLRAASASDAANYVTWFDLGFVENVLGKVEDSIAAYRRSV